MSRIGIITQKSEDNLKYRVSFADYDNNVSYWCFLIEKSTNENKHFHDLAINSLVLVEFPENDPEQGYIIGSVFNKKNIVKNSEVDSVSSQFKDDTDIIYSVANHELTINIPDGIGKLFINTGSEVEIITKTAKITASDLVDIQTAELNINANSKATITAPTFTVNGFTQLNGGISQGAGASGVRLGVHSLEYIKSVSAVFNSPFFINNYATIDGASIAGFDFAGHIHTAQGSTAPTTPVSG